MSGPDTPAPASVSERFVPTTPTVNPDPVWDHPDNPHLCANCPGWQRHRMLPFGQCLPAIKAFGAPMYTPELAGCSLDMASKAKR